jgi:hypothetical protein
VDDVIALMVLRHYEVPTRLLDWSQSPFVAACFAVSYHEIDDAEIWAFDHDPYARSGKQQWRKWPETTLDGSGDDELFRPNMTAFKQAEPPDWFVCAFYPGGFPRQNAQEGLYSLTARFGRDHADAISNLLADSSHHHLYVIPANLKPAVKKLLHEKHGICLGSLFPDTAGAARTALTVFCR